MKPTRSLASAVVILLAWAAIGGGAASPSRAATELSVAAVGDVDASAYPAVTATISVVDRTNGRSVLDLKADSFSGADAAGPLKILDVAPTKASDQRAATGYVLAIDTSYAMKRGLAGGGTYLDRAKLVANAFVAQLGSNDRVLLVAFNDGADTSRTQWVSRNDPNLRAAIESLAATDLTASMSSAITASADKAVKAEDNLARHAVVLITAVDDDRAIPQMNDQALKDLHAQFFSIGIGQYSPAASTPPFLTRLGQQSAGGYWSVDGPPAPDKQIERIYELTQLVYRVRFEASGLPDSGPHDATISVTSTEGLGETKLRYQSKSLCAVSCAEFKNIAKGENLASDRDIEVGLKGKVWRSYHIELFRDCNAGASCSPVAQSENQAILYKVAVAPLDQGAHQFVVKITASDGTRVFTDVSPPLQFTKSGTNWGGAIAGAVVVLAAVAVVAGITFASIRRRRTV